MAIMYIKSNDRVFICGQTGGGKTELAKRIFEQIERGIVYDIGWETKLEGLGRVVHDYKEIEMSKSNKWVLQPENENEEYFDGFCKWVFFNLDNLMLYVEEVSDLATVHNITPHFRKILRRGRKIGIGCIMVSQQTADVNKLCISQAQHVISFYQFEKNHVEYLLKCCGLGTQYRDTILNLRDYEFFYYNQKEVKVMPKIEVEEVRENE